MKIAIFGAYGLVGSNFCDYLDKFITDSLEVTKIKCDEFENIEGEFDIIYYGSGYGQPQMFAKDKIRTIEINTTSLIKAFSYLKPGGKFLFISTSEVYSGAEPPYMEGFLGTTTPQHPRACYIESKRCGEAICMAYREHGYDVKIARLALAYGMTKLGDTRVLNQFIEQGLKGKIVLRDAGTALRTYCYVEDACELMWKILLQGKKAVYNVGGFSTITIAELAKEIGKIMNAKVTIPQDDQGLKDAPQEVSLNMEATLKEFNQSFTPLDKGLRKTIRKYYA